MGNVLFTPEEINAIEKLYLSVAFGDEKKAMQDEKTYQILINLFQRMGFSYNYDQLSIRSHYYFGKDIDKIISLSDDLDYEECGNLLYFIVKDRQASDPTSGQFSKYFNTFLIYLLNKVFDKTKYQLLIAL